MPSSFSTGAASLKLVPLLCFLLVSLFGGISLVRAQDGCPQSSGARTFLPGHKYYVYVNPFLRGTTKETQIRQALDQWSYDNTHKNGSGVTFDYTTSRHDWPAGAFFVEFHEEAFADEAGNPREEPGAVFDTIHVVGAYLAEVRIIFNSNAVVDPARNFYPDGGGPYYDPNQAGYDSIYAKVSRHELGHGMGLDHPASGVLAGSVMNGKLPCANDKCNWLPFFITDCDNQKVSEEFAPPPPPPPVGCDPVEEWNCNNGGGNWDSGSCTCDYSNNCDAGQEQDCYYQGGSWDPNSCTCSGGGCNPGSPVLVWSDSQSCSICDCAGGDGTRETCTRYYSTYEQYCQDGSLYNSWTEESSLFCGSSGEYCDDCWMGDCE